MISKKLCFGMPIIVSALGVMFSGCATTINTSNHFEVHENENYGTVQLWGAFASRENFLRINGEDVIVRTPAQIILPSGRNEFELMVRVNRSGAGLVGALFHDVVVGYVELDIVAGRMYNLRVENTIGGNVANFFLLRGRHRFVFQELMPGTTRRRTIAEFPTRTLRRNTWNPAPQHIETDALLPEDIAVSVFFVDIDGVPMEHTVDELRELVRQGRVTRQTLVWREGMDQWVPAGTVTELSGILPVVPPPLPPR